MADSSWLMADGLQSKFFPPVEKRLKYSPPPEGWHPTKEDDGVVFCLFAYSLIYKFADR